MTAPKSNLRRKNEWLKPSTLLAGAALAVTVFIAWNTGKDNDAYASVRIENRVSTLEATLNTRVLPALQRIENKIDK
jgi:hypothetical protein